MKLTHKDKDMVIRWLSWWSFAILLVCGAGMVAALLRKEPPQAFTYMASHAVEHAAWKLEAVIYDNQTHKHAVEASYQRGYLEGVIDVKRGRHGLSSDAEGLCYTMLTQEQARRFLDELRKMREERPVEAPTASTTGTSDPRAPRK